MRADGVAEAMPWRRPLVGRGDPRMAGVTERYEPGGVEAVWSERSFAGVVVDVDGRGAASACGLRSEHTGSDLPRAGSVAAACGAWSLMLAASCVHRGRPPVAVRSAHVVSGPGRKRVVLGVDARIPANRGRPRAASPGPPRSISRSRRIEARSRTRPLREPRSPRPTRASAFTTPSAATGRGAGRRRPLRRLPLEPARARRQLGVSGARRGPGRLTARLSLRARGRGCPRSSTGIVRTNVSPPMSIANHARRPWP
jgi:hypothetical protein